MLAATDVIPKGNLRLWRPLPGWSSLGWIYLGKGAGSSHKTLRRAPSLLRSAKSEAQELATDSGSGRRQVAAARSNRQDQGRQTGKKPEGDEAEGKLASRIDDT
jgi:hypothetical protein